MTDSVKYCRSCGGALNGARFCPACGTAGQHPSSAGPPVVTDASTDDVERNLAMACLLAAAGMVVGSFLPWATVTAPIIGTMTISGIDAGDGWIGVAAGVACLLGGLALLGHIPKASAMGLVSGSAVTAGALATYEYSQIAKSFGPARSVVNFTGSFLGIRGGDLVDMTYGVGLHLLAVSAVGALALAGILLTRLR